MFKLPIGWLIGAGVGVALIIALVIAGAVLIIDGVGWFLGHPLLPVW